MKDPKDIQRLFEDADEKLIERPRPAAWERLSDKLDRHEEQAAPTAPSKLLPLYKRFPAWQVAASLLLLVGLFTFAIQQLPSAQKQMVMADTRIQLEDIPMEGTNAGFYALAVKCRQFYNTSPTEAVAEVQVPSRLRLANRTNRLPTTTRTAIADNTSKPPAGDMIGSSIALKTLETATATEGITDHATDQQVAADYSSEAIATADVQPAPPVAATQGYDADTRYDKEEAFLRGEAVDAAKATAPAPVAKEEIASMDEVVVVENGLDELESYPTGKVDKKKKRKNAKDKKRAAEQADMSVNATSNVMVYQAEDKNSTNTNDLAAFQWLIGSWSAVNQQQEVMQNWQMKDQFTLTGEATFTINGNPIQIQSMEIQKQGDGIYLLIANKADNTKQRFQLKSMEAAKATFAESGEEFIIEQVDANQFLNFSNQPVYQSNVGNGGALQFNGLNFSRIKE